MREFSTSSMVMSSFITALGCIWAHFRVETDTSAICSSVVPYSCMWRVAGKENVVGAPKVP